MNARHNQQIVTVSSFILLGHSFHLILKALHITKFKHIIAQLNDKEPFLWGK